MAKKSTTGEKKLSNSEIEELREIVKKFETDSESVSRLLYENALSLLSALEGDDNAS